LNKTNVARFLWNGTFGLALIAKLAPHDDQKTSKSWTTIRPKEGLLMPLPPVHPGEILSDELAELSVSPTELARQLRVPHNRITQIVQGKRAITGDTALRLGHWFGTSPVFWMNLQSLYDVRLAEQQVGSEVAGLPRREDGVTGRSGGAAE
jgi:addiction module HigA family antidote